MRAFFSLAPLLLVTACGPSSTPHTTIDGGSGSCTGTQTRCYGQVFQECSNGSWSDVETCSGATNVCDQTAGCVECDPDLANTCVGNEVHVCNAGVIGAYVQTCVQTCVSGVCNDPCTAAAANRSYIGCEYWPVDLDNAIEVIGLATADMCGTDCHDTDIFGDEYCPGTTLVNYPVCVGAGDGTFPDYAFGLCDPGSVCPSSVTVNFGLSGTHTYSSITCQTTGSCVLDAQHSPFAIVVSNPNTDNPVNVTVTNGSQTQTVSVGAGSVQAIYPQNMGFADQSLDGSGIQAKAYKLTSSLPIVAYQFNPLNNVGVFSNDGSLLIPFHAFDDEYFVSTYPTLTRRPDTNDYNGYIAIVAGGPGTTHVTVTPTAAVRAGTGFTAIAAGAETGFDLTQYQVLNLEAVADGDLTGTYITASQPVGVFAGHEATVLYESTGACCADHLEDMVFPASTWGWNYAVAHTEPRVVDTVTMNEPELLKITAQKAGTPVTITPTPTSTNCTGTLTVAQTCYAWFTGDIQVTADETHPILVSHFIPSVIGSGATEAAQGGDPSMSYAVPVEQFRTDYFFLIPKDYAANYVNVVAPAASTAITLDGTDITSSMTTFGVAAGYKAVRHALGANEGAHVINCPGTCGIEVYGWGEAVSYLFAGGLDLEQIVVE